MSRRQPPTLTCLVAAVLAATASACAPTTDSADPPRATAVPETTAAAPTPALPIARLGDETVLTLELALTQEEITQGLMYRPSLPENRGMLFVFQAARVPSFWMKNTLIPLDLVFLNPDGTIAEIVHNAQPCAVEPCPQYVPARAAKAVLELNAGTAERHGLETGDVIEFERVPGYPVER